MLKLRLDIARCHRIKGIEKQKRGNDGVFFLAKVRFCQKGGKKALFKDSLETNLQ